ncbi:tripartite tricarboxylate transporter substrate binding protein [Pseudorhodoplanes sp.]|uniref:Bug family tripartite tricarboxylate transporter substrate binding protein n=1 Tax=Pseudorhodoplanes sp. TaxID=1934341 RepID=UPI002CE12EA0|nr:tripartite tricarboxylate transporter substrate binding protein [Pseudorhodoplanes sp.]HWV53945.1 tripartite tricarboxylate transporter substrate binding protein [Pseudorhodoplanes sp.]
MMIRSVRRASLAVACAASLLATPSFAQEWPTKPITAVVPLGAGSASDIIARVVMDQVSRQVGQPVVVENRPGAGGTIGANAVAKAAPDGYTILAYGALNTAHAMHAKLPYDTFKDFIPVISLGQQPLVIVTSPGKGYKTLKDMIAAGKAKPGALNYSTVGPGSASHFGAARLMMAGGFDAQHLPFKGAAEAVTDVVADRSDFSVQLTATTLPLIKDGKLVPLAVSAHKRIPSLPDTPTTIELGLPPESVYPFYTGIYVPANTPPAIVDRWHREIAKALEAPEVKTRFAQLGVQPMPGSQAEFARFFHDDVSSTVALAKAAKVQPQ